MKFILSLLHLGNKVNKKQRLSVASEFCRHNTMLQYFCEGGTNINFLLCDKIQGVAH